MEATETEAKDGLIMFLDFILNPDLRHALESFGWFTAFVVLSIIAANRASHGGEA